MNLRVLALCLLLPLSAAAQRLQLDGKLDPAEWRGAEVHLMDASGAVLVRAVRGDTVALGIRLAGRHLPSVFLFHADSVYVLQLGGSAPARVRYAPTDTAWVHVPDSLPPSGGWAATGWAASAPGQGDPGTLEVHLHLSRYADARLAVATADAGNVTQVHSWPSTLQDATRNADLLRGAAPGTLVFAPQQWAPLLPPGHDPADYLRAARGYGAPRNLAEPVSEPNAVVIETTTESTLTPTGYRDNENRSIRLQSRSKGKRKN